MAKWLFKSEPDVFSFDELVSRGKDGEEWDGVRNYQARNNMREMKEGDLGFFYHSRSGLEIVGIVEVCNEAHADSTTEDERWECVDIRAVKPLPRAITMKEIKAEPRLKDMVLANNSRLSVQPVSEAEWAVVLEMAGA
ncbi:EVE domain-containing protein [Pseudoroseicyclus sp. CXY001]|uniref:EVE domain-containing protein n=1 Tax=Pseudoroseicyclus sp. CXY001 TaxID=3242492 RepID=UPI00358DC954